MKLLTGFLTEGEVMARSHALYADLPDAATRYLLGWKKHRDRDEWALCVPQDHEETLPPEDQVLLVEDDWPESQLNPL